MKIGRNTNNFQNLIRYFVFPKNVETLLFAACRLRSRTPNARNLLKITFQGRVTRNGPQEQILKQCISAYPSARPAPDIHQYKRGEDAADGSPDPGRMDLAENHPAPEKAEQRHDVGYQAEEDGPRPLQDLEI